MLLNSINTELKCLFAGWLSYSSVVKHLCVQQAVLGSIPGGNQIFLIVYGFFKKRKKRKKACERERIHLYSIILKLHSCL